MSKKVNTPWGKGSVVQTKTGKQIVLLNPQQKAQKFFHERTDYPDGGGVKYTNDGKVKTVNGEVVALTPTEMSYRQGYEQAVKDGNRLFRAKNPDYKSKHVPAKK